jgi:hypothetical protein
MPLDLLLRSSGLQTLAVKGLTGTPSPTRLLQGRAMLRAVHAQHLAAIAVAMLAANTKDGPALKQELERSVEQAIETQPL